MKGRKWDVVIDNPTSVPVWVRDAAQVLKVREILEGLGLEIATPDEAREILALKGADQAGF